MDGQTTEGPEPARGPGRRDGGGDGGAPARRRRRARSWRRRLLVTLAALPAIALGLWLAVHHIPGFGSLCADALRAVFGKRFVAWLEDTAYGLEDWVNRRTRAGEAPEPAWEVPVSAAPKAGPAPSGAKSGQPPAPPEPPFTLANLAPMHASVATGGEGVWLPLPDPRQPDDRTRMLKTFLHPDKNRSWSIVAIVAVDLKHADLHIVAGRYEPESRTKEAKSYQRKAIVPPEQHDRLLAAFNGGYKTTHGYYGMKIDGVTLVDPRPLACAIAKYRDGHFAIRPWEALGPSEPDMLWFRQTPICMFDEGKPHPALGMADMGWGASSVSKTTVIRRSAIGLDASGRLLLVGIGDFLTGQSIGEAMHHAGADYVAQLDVNFSFPKLVTYELAAPGSEELRAIPLTKHFEYAEDEFVGTRAQRDFFYLVRRDPGR